jgi:DNA polymerase-4
VRVGYLQLTGPLLVSAADLLTPLSPVVEPDGPLAAWFDATGVRLTLGSEAAYGAAVLAAVAAAGGQARLGIGPSTWVAQVATRLGEPGEVTVVEDAETRAFLRPLPLEWLPLPRPTLTTLRLLGMQTMGQFADLPRAAVGRRFGSEAVAAHRLACGEDDRPLRGAALEPAVLVRVAPEPPLVERGQLRATLLRLAAGGLAELRQRGQAARTVTLGLASAGGACAEQARHLPHPVTELEALLPHLDDLAGALLRTRLGPSVAVEGIGAVWLRLAGIAPPAVAQAHLPGLEEPETGRAVRERVWGELRRRYPGRVPRLLEVVPAAPLPEERWRLDAWPHRLVELRARDGRRALRLDGRWHRVVAGGLVERVDLWWPRERHRRVVWVALADGQRLLLGWERPPGHWLLLGRLD